ncbi:hypothetical protein C2845_PM09G14490 [Panicum miliaceum]|uniref:Uncharacterized protein n=1 Tax=Panicum miliaceum TaxID=4540 RepID=A0A3L6RXK0_PANMI|nr:hypothetical protein C2845_PM09G14490 [Panicum miliaceum]
MPHAELSSELAPTSTNHPGVLLSRHRTSPNRHSSAPATSLAGAELDITAPRPCTVDDPPSTTSDPGSCFKPVLGERLVLPHNFPTAGEPSPRRILALTTAAMPRGHIANSSSF